MLYAPVLYYFPSSSLGLTAWAICNTQETIEVKRHYKKRSFSERSPSDRGTKGPSLKIDYVRCVAADGTKTDNKKYSALGILFVMAYVVVMIGLLLTLRLKRFPKGFRKAVEDVHIKNTGKDLLKFLKKLERQQPELWAFTQTGAGRSLSPIRY